MNSHPLAEKGWDTDETQPWWSRTTKMQKEITAAWLNITTVPQLCLDYVPPVGWQMETNGDMVSFRDNGLEWGDK